MLSGYYPEDYNYANTAGRDNYIRRLVRAEAPELTQAAADEFARDFLTILDLPEIPRGPHFAERNH